jgi:hypothetical protein
MKLKVKEIKEIISFLKQNYGNNWTWDDIPAYIRQSNKMKVYKILKEEGKEKGFLEFYNELVESKEFWEKVVKKST